MEINNREYEDNDFTMISLEPISNISAISCNNENIGEVGTVFNIKTKIMSKLS